MAGWSGFSEEDLRRMHQKEPVSSSGRGRKPAPTNRSRQQLQRERALCQAAQQRDASAQLPPEQQLAKPAVRTPNQTAPKITPENKSEKSATSQLQEPVVVNYHSVPIPEPTIMAKELEKQEVELREKTRLELLQQEQRMMEEKNKRKKALLAKTIAEKSKQTQAEAVKLKKIQKELQALDDMVSNDIGILRGRIEQASWDYSTARKRYEKAEVEYVSAKLDLHSKTEVKEQLTEHLYAIIQENEQRKARKLEQLMRQLELQEDEERLELEIQVDHMLQEVEAQEEVKARVETGGQVERGGQGEVQGGGEVQTQVEGGGQVEVQTQVEGGGQVEVQIQVEGGGQVEVQTQVEVEVEVKAQVETDTPVESLLTESQTEPKTSNPPDSVAAEVPASPS